METALQHNGIVYELATPGKAKYFRMRCYYYRKLLHAELVKRSNVTVTRTKFDALQIEQDVDNKARLFFRLSSAQAAGNLTDIEGKPLVPSLSTPEDMFRTEPDLIQEAPTDAEAYVRDMMKKLGTPE